MHKPHCSLCFPTLCIVSSCLVRSYGLVKAALHALAVMGLILSQRCGPSCVLPSRCSRCPSSPNVFRWVQYHTLASSTFVHLLLGGVALREYVHISQVADTVVPVLLCRVDGWNTIMITSTVNRTSRPGTHCHNSHKCQSLPIVSMRSERLSHTLTARSRTTNVAGHEQSLDDVLLHSYY